MPCWDENCTLPSCVSERKAALAAKEQDKSNGSSEIKKSREDKKMAKKTNQIDAAADKIVSFAKNLIRKRHEFEAECGDDDTVDFEVSDLVRLLKKKVINDSDALELSISIVHGYSTYDLAGYEGSEALQDIEMDNDAAVVKTINMIKNEIKKQHTALTRPNTVKSRLVKRGKTVATKTLARKISRKLTENTQKLVVSLLKDNPRFRGVSDFAAGEIGSAVTSFLLATGLEFVPLPEAIREAMEPMKDEIVNELGVAALDKGTEPLEMLGMLMLPIFQQALAPLLTGGAATTKQLPEAIAEVVTTMKSGKNAA